LLGQLKSTQEQWGGSRGREKDRGPSFGRMKKKTAWPSVEDKGEKQPLSKGGKGEKRKDGGGH